MAIQKSSKTSSDDNGVILDGDSMFADQEAPSQPVSTAAPAGQATTMAKMSTPTSNPLSTVVDTPVSGVLSASDMEDLDFGFGAFPSISLDKGEFECIGDIEFEDNQFQCKIMNYRAKYFYRSFINDDDVEFFYSFDKPGMEGSASTNGELVQDIVGKWKEEGRPAHTVKKYLEVTAQLVGGPSANSICLLSVAPRSVPILSGYIAGELNAVRGLHYTKVVTQVSAGPKNSKGKFPFRPWNFSFVSAIVEG